MKPYKILLYSDFFCEYEIILTNIPRNELEHFLFMYANFYDLGIDIEKVIKASGYSFKYIAGNTSYNNFYDWTEYQIKESDQFFINDFLMEGP